MQQLFFTRRLGLKKSNIEYNKKNRCNPVIKFKKQKITSFSGIIIFFNFFKEKDFFNKIKQSVNHIQDKTVIGYHKIFIILTLHLLLGFRQLREIECYCNDPLVLRFLSLKKLPDLSTITRNISKADKRAIDALRQINREDILKNLVINDINKITIDFDGSVLSTGRRAEGTAVGFNKKKKGQRSYYPLFCTIAQTGQVFDFHHRPGNVHDSNGACDFIITCIRLIRNYLPYSEIEVRMDSAFFDDDIVDVLEEKKIDFTISVPFERFPELKGMIEGRKRWKNAFKNFSYFFSKWSPKCWEKKYQFVFIRQKVAKQEKGVIQLDLFRPVSYEYSYTVVISNKQTTAKKILTFHHGRGNQENIFSELKTQVQMDYIPTNSLHGNQLYLLAAIFAHNQTRSLQMEIKPKRFNDSPTRKPLWLFQEIKTFRRRIINISGSLAQPARKLTLTINDNKIVEKFYKEHQDIFDLKLCA